MDQLRSNSGNAEENSGIPDDLRCKRSDGKQWRCTAMSMPDKTVCEKHYIQAKKRAANSQMRAKKRKSLGEADIYLESKTDDFDVPAASVSSKKYKEKVPKNQMQYSPEEPSGTNNINLEDDSQVDATSFEENWKSHGTPSLTATDRNRSQTSFDDMATAAEDSDDSSDEGFVGQTCHQCRRNDTERVTWCLKCEKRGYCDSCISTWYSDVSLEEFEKACPACRGSCYCKVCIRGDNMIKVRIREIPVLDKLQYLYSLLSSVLPVVKKIHHEQCAEVELEKKLRGKEIDLARVRLNADEQMCCNICRIPIIDYHRHCSNCSYDLCISCCQDLRGTSLVGVHSDINNQNGDRNHVTETAEVELSQFRMSLSGKFPGWIANSDGSIPCPPKEHGGCGHQSLNLNRIFKMNWVAKLVKNVEEMVSGCKVYDIGSPLKIELNEPSLCRFADREGGNDNFLYCPSSQVIKAEGIADFRKHWDKGEPVIVNQVCDNSSVSSWDPMVIWTGIRDTADEKVQDEGRTIKAIDCLDWSEVEIEVEQFIKGYSGGRIRESGLPEILKLKDWPSPGASEEFLMYQRPEFISKLPLLEYIHSRLGLLNVAAKLPHYSLQNDVGPKIYISYGTNEEIGGGDPVTNLHFKMRDMVYLLIHTSKMKVKGQEHTNMMEEEQLKKGEEHTNMTEIHLKGQEHTNMTQIQPSNGEAEEHTNMTHIQPSNGEAEVIEPLEDHEKHTNMTEIQPSNAESEVIELLEDHEKHTNMTEIQLSNGESEVIEPLENHEKHTNMTEIQPSNGKSEVSELLEDHEKQSDERKSPDLSVAEPDLGNESGMNSARDGDVKMEEFQGTKDLSVEEETVSFEKLNGDCGEFLDMTRPGAAWDVFRREDVPKLVEFVQVHWGDFAKLGIAKPNMVSQTLHDEVVFLNELQKRKLKEEYGVEPWSFEQHVGEAVFIPAGCPFQLRNLQSTVQLGLDFLFPESVREAARLAEEIRILPNDHEAKLQILEVGKISLYAASSAIKEVQKLVLDPKLGKELGFEDPNLTASVSENLEKVKHNRQITCR